MSDVRRWNWMLNRRLYSVHSAAFVDTWKYSQVRPQAVSLRLVLYCISSNHSLFQFRLITLTRSTRPSHRRLLVSHLPDWLQDSLTVFGFRISDLLTVFLVLVLCLIIFFSSMSYSTVNWLLFWRALYTVGLSAHHHFIDCCNCVIYFHFAVVAVFFDSRPL